MTIPTMITIFIMVILRHPNHHHHPVIISSWSSPLPWLRTTGDTVIAIAEGGDLLAMARETHSVKPDHHDDDVWDEDDNDHNDWDDKDKGSDDDDV